LFLATPIKFSGRLLQYLGRVLRPAAPGKDKARVYDYLDPVGVLENAALARQWVYGPQGEIAHAIQKFNNKKGISSAVQAGVAGQGELA
ncbi:MAG: hypothetical protein NTY36_00845, partial [Deltaproteobacteria bacterium]|nr:hypothetical protein [Deltaproteobacteria bacterium]